LKILKNLAILVAVILSLMTACNIWWREYSRAYYLGLVPRKLEVSNIMYVSQKCYFAVFELSAKTIVEINQQGINFFKDAKEPRAYEIKENRATTYLYGEWQKTPIQDSPNNKYFWAGTNCVRDHDLDIDLSSFGVIRFAPESSGSFYTGHIEGQLVVIPRLRIAVLSGIGD
jgi:hypothetical protein